MIAETYAVLVADLAEGMAVTGHAGYVAGVSVLTAWPDVVNPPAVIVAPPQGTWIEGGQTFGGSFRVHADLLCLVAKDIDQLQHVVETALCYSADWGGHTVDGLGTVTIGGRTLLGCLIHLSKTTKL